MAESRLNIALFKAIRDKIASAPDAYDQCSWGRREDDAPCGTAACIAGWACALSNQVRVSDLVLARTGRVGAGYIDSLAQAALGLDRHEAAILFNPNPHLEDYDEMYGQWPEPFAEQWREAEDDVHAEARVAVAYLTHIIETGKVL